MSWTDKSQWFLHDGQHNDADALVRAYHYSGRPAGTWHYTAHEAGGLFGDFGPAFAVCSFGMGARAFSEDVVELVRLVLAPSHAGFPLTSLIAKACAAMRRAGHDLAVSYADTAQGHHGGVYQAASWLFHGVRYGAGTIANGSTTPCVDGFVIDGVFVPRRTCNARYGTSSVSALRVRQAVILETIEQDRETQGAQVGTCLDAIPQTRRTTVGGRMTHRQWKNPGATRILRSLPTDAMIVLEFSAPRRALGSWSIMARETSPRDAAWRFCARMLDQNGIRLEGMA